MRDFDLHNPNHRRLMAALENENIFSKAVGFLPSDIPGLVLWLKADSLALADGDAVTTWTDSSGLGNNATQAVVDNKPLYKVNIINGKPVVRYDGIDDLLDVTTLAINQPDTIFIAVDLDVVTGGHHFFDTSGGARQLINGAGWGMYAGTPLDGVGAPDTNPYILSAVFNGVSSALYANGTLKVSGDAGANGLSGNIHICAGTGGADVAIDGDVSEVIIYSSALSDANRMKVEDYLSAKWGIAVTH